MSPYLGRNQTPSGLRNERSVNEALVFDKLTKPRYQLLCYQCLHYLSIHQSTGGGGWGGFTNIGKQVCAIKQGIFFRSENPRQNVVFMINMAIGDLATVVRTKENVI